MTPCNFGCLDKIYYFKAQDESFPTTYLPGVCLKKEFHMHHCQYYKGFLDFVTDWVAQQCSEELEKKHCNIGNDTCKFFFQIYSWRICR